MSHAEDRLLLIVVGTSLDAERHDRPLAGSLAEAAETAQQSLDVATACEIVICSDVWLLNDASLLSSPVIALGRPEVNAATAFLARRVPTALVIDHAYRIHIDPTGIERHACIWGTNPQTTSASVEAFRQRYLTQFLRAAHDLPIEST